MAKKEAVPVSDRVSASFQKLSQSAEQLNAASDELGKAIAPIDAALKALNLGVPAWHKMAGSQSRDGLYWARYVGYSKIGRRWGIALSTVEGHEAADDENNEEWLFNDAPRWLRVEGIEHLPDLLEELARKAETTTAELAKSTAHAKELAATIATLAQATE
jgi:methyl-accepting chemotaxis protein